MGIKTITLIKKKEVVTMKTMGEQKQALLDTVDKLERIISNFNEKYGNMAFEELYRHFHGYNKDEYLFDFCYDIDQQVGIDHVIASLKIDEGKISLVGNFSVAFTGSDGYDAEFKFKEDMTEVAKIESGEHSEMTTGQNSNLNPSSVFVKSQHKRSI